MSRVSQCAIKETGQHLPLVCNFVITVRCEAEAAGFIDGEPGVRCPWLSDLSQADADISASEAQSDFMPVRQHLVEGISDISCID